jgi:hypothetical protein
MNEGSGQELVQSGAQTVGGALVKADDLRIGGRFESLNEGLTNSERTGLVALARSGKLTDDAVNQARALATSQHDKNKDGQPIVAAGQLLYISGKFDVAVPIASELADVATDGQEKLSQQRVTKVFKEVCNALGRRGQDRQHLEHVFNKLAPHQQISLIQEVGVLADVASDYEMTLSPLINLYVIYGEVGQVQHIVELCCTIAQSQSGDRELSASTVINRLLGAIRKAELVGSSISQVEQFLYDGNYSGIVALSMGRESRCDSENS